MRQFIADLHLHSLLSPCAELEMTPANIVRYAIKHGIDIIALTDHNACDNVAAAMDAAAGTNVAVIPGMEVETREEVHVVVLFEKMRQLKEWEAYVDRHRTKRLNDAAKFGAQFIVDSDDNFIAEKQEMLLGSLNLALTDLTAKVGSLGGISIASHIDRPVYSIISQLGFIPPELNLTAVEISPRFSDSQKARAAFRSIGELAVLKNSDAHTIDDFVNGPKTKFYLAEATFSEIKQALLGENLRKVIE
ncbi:MAG: PHP domain-containing protein [Sporomusaceae bacterium]|jgi:PHP family Zn ribbon phosphoesterase|nr:PHP domain-containing protein [Sporomusaceae bacterium]